MTFYLNRLNIVCRTDSMSGNNATKFQSFEISTPHIVRVTDILLEVIKLFFYFFPRQYSLSRKSGEIGSGPERLQECSLGKIRWSTNRDGGLEEEGERADPATGLARFRLFLLFGVARNQFQALQKRGGGKGKVKVKAWLLWSFYFRFFIQLEATQLTRYTDFYDITSI